MYVDYEKLRKKLSCLGHKNWAILMSQITIIFRKIIGLNYPQEKNARFFSRYVIYFSMLLPYVHLIRVNNKLIFISQPPHMYCCKQLLTNSTSSNGHFDIMVRYVST